MASIMTGYVIHPDGQSKTYYCELPDEFLPPNVMIGRIFYKDGLSLKGIQLSLTISNNKGILKVGKKVVHFEYTDSEVDKAAFSDISINIMQKVHLILSKK